MKILEEIDSAIQYEQDQKFRDRVFADLGLVRIRLDISLGTLPTMYRCQTQCSTCDLKMEYITYHPEVEESLTCFICKGNNL